MYIIYIQGPHPISRQVTAHTTCQYDNLIFNKINNNNLIINLIIYIRNLYMHRSYYNK